MADRLNESIEIAKQRLRDSPDIRCVKIPLFDDGMYTLTIKRENRWAAFTDEEIIDISRGDIGTDLYKELMFERGRRDV